MNRFFQKVCDQYSLGALEKKPEQVPGGLLHTVWCLHTAKGKYALKVIDKNHFLENENLLSSQQSEDIAVIMQARGIPTVSALQLSNQKKKTQLEVIVMPWVEGKVIPALDLKPENIKKIGKLLGQIHSINFNHYRHCEERCVPRHCETHFSPRHCEEHFFPRHCEEQSDEAIQEDSKYFSGLLRRSAPRNDEIRNAPRNDEIHDAFRHDARKWKEAEWRQLFQYVNKNTSLLDYLQQTLSPLIIWSELASKATERNQDTIFSHRDLDDKNVLWHKEQPTLLDWEYAGNIHPMLDLLIVALNWSGVQYGTLSQVHFQAILSGFNEVRALPGKLKNEIFHLYYGYCLDWLIFAIKKNYGEEIKKTIEAMLLVEKNQHTLISWFNKAPS